MFDAKSLLEALVTGAGQRQAQPADGLGGLGDLLGGLLKGQPGNASSGQVPNQTGGGIEDLLRNFLPGGPASSQPSAQEPAKHGGLDDLFRNMLPSGDAQGHGGGLGDLLGKLKDQMGGAGAGGMGAGGAGGGLADILGQVFGQATSGAKEGASRIGEATGAREALDKITGGKSADDLMNQLKDLLSNNQLGAGAALGGLGALVLGTRTGRTLAANAAKLGALALIGGLAYHAYQNYAQGRPATAERNLVPTEAPQGSGFEPQATTNAQAALYIRAMIGAAAADGRIDSGEQQKILGSLQQVGAGDGAEEFLANELNNPSTAAHLAEAVTSEQEAVQVYTAARIAIDPDTRGEQAFLYELAQRLRIPNELRSHIDAAAVSAAA
ncbi:MAG: tellurite resistance TerB family protein [Hyphomicrobiaceae bacterium]|nr:tellurite resistance TerB family protein [Hyphomicrobiaceae bacterium]